MLKNSRLLLAITVLVLSGTIEPAHSQSQVVLNPSKDNTLYENAAGALSNGVGSYLFARKTAGNLVHRAVMSFDIAGNIPAGATIVGVELSLSMNKTISGAQPATLHRLTTDWGEGTSDALAQEGGGATSTTGDATWIHSFFPANFWTAPGGDFSPTASASTSVAAIGSYIFGTTTDMEGDVQSWLDNPGSNFGWILIGEENVLSSSKRYGSGNNLVEGDRPALTILYSTGPCCVGIGGNANGDAAQNVNISDITYLVDYLFGIPLGPAPPCQQEGNANGDGTGSVNISDITYLVDYLFGIPLGPAPPACL